MQAQIVPSCWQTGSGRPDAHARTSWPLQYRERISAAMLRPMTCAWEKSKSRNPSNSNSNLETTFYRLANEWRNETWFVSSIKKRIAHPSHLKIIGLGRPVIPFIVGEMRKSDGYWFWALEAITREDPAPNAENISELETAWLAWADAHGY